MHFEDHICCDQKGLKIKLKNSDYEFIGNDKQMLVKTKDELYIVLKASHTIRGEFEAVDTKNQILIIDEREVSFSQVDFIGKIG